MGIIIILILTSLVLALGFLAAFLWSMRSGQYDDTHSPAIRMLFDEPPTRGNQGRIHTHSSDIRPGSINEASQDQAKTTPPANHGK